MMVLFGFILFVSAAALLAVRLSDIARENRLEPGRTRTTIQNHREFPAESMGLRQL
jgi:hypothetical protein